MTAVAQEEGTGMRRLMQGGLLLLPLWGMVAVLDASLAYLDAAVRGLTPSWPASLAMVLPVWVGWALLAPFVLEGVRRVPLEPPNVGRALVLHLLLGAALVLLHEGGLRAGAALGWTAAAAVVPDWLEGRLQAGLLLYVLLAVAGQAYEWYRRCRAQADAVARLGAQRAALEEEVARAHQQALKMQLHPHFLFNVLHAVGVLVRERQDRVAVRMLTRLGDLLRMTLDRAEVREVTLQDELDFVMRYLEVEQIRFADRLRVKVEVDPAVAAALVPNMIVQPLVENAVRHGIARRAEGGQVEIRAMRRGGLLYLEVCDDGPGFTEDGYTSEGTGIGLSNTRRRLAQCYGPRHRLECSNRPEGGAVVALALPFRTARKAQDRPSDRAPEQREAGLATWHVTA